MLAGRFAEHAKGCPKEPTARKVEGCDEPLAIPTFRIDGNDFHRCPLHYVTPDVLEVVRVWKWTRRGHLPLAGGILDQPMRLMEQLDVIESVYEQTCAEDAKRGE